MTENNVIRLRQRGGRGWQETSGAIYRAIMSGTLFVSGAMEGTKSLNSGKAGVGQLPKRWEEIFNQDQPDYIVWSYATPIAWHVPNDGDGDDERWVIPYVKYSATTTRHQNLVRTALVFDSKPYVESLSDA